MADARVKAVGGYFLRLVGGVAVILGVLGVFASLSQGNLIGAALSVAFIAGGAFMVKKSGGMSRSGDAPSTPRGTRP
jgi:hypothetical protein